MDRLRYYITAPLESFHGDSQDAAGMRFIVSTHWHLHRIFPDELAQAQKPLIDLVRAEVNAAADDGLIHPRNPDWDAWLIVDLVRSVYHHYAYAAKSDDDLDGTKEHLWEFCRTALGASRI